MIGALAATVIIVLVGLFWEYRWLAVVGTVLLCFAYVLALAEGRRS